MKKSMKSVIMMIFIAMPSLFFAQKTTETITIKTSAQCDMCKKTLEKAMAYEKGVKSSSLEVSSAVLSVEFNPKKTTPDKIRKAVSDVGYDADEVKADPKAYDNLPDCCKKGGHK